METFKIYKNLVLLNELPVEKAEDLFTDCSGSHQWAQGMEKSRPFVLLENLYDAADAIWFALSPAEWILAFARSHEEPPSTDLPDPAVLASAEAERLYKDKFGFIFVVCPLGKSYEEILAVCKARLSNSRETELQIAAEEQRKIIEIRLNRLLEQ